MRVITGDLWDMTGQKVVPVNLSRDMYGNAVMGRGVAAQAVEKYPALPKIYGEHLGRYFKGDTDEAPYIPRGCGRIICLPVKNHWTNMASWSLLRTGLQFLIDHTYVERTFIPLLGCGFGELETLPVLTLMASILKDDRFVLVLNDDHVIQRYPDSFRRGARADNTTLSGSVVKARHGSDH